jgi:hypothetical protein
MKNSPRVPVGGVVQERGGSSNERSRPRQRGIEGLKSAHKRAQQKAGAYKRVEVFLGVEAAIALRQLMRDGRSAREVIEALLLAEKLRRREERQPQRDP